MLVNRILLKLLPSQIKYRLMLAFLVFILLPYTYIQLYNFEKIERTIRSNIIGQNREQLEFLKNSYEDMKVSIQNAVLLFENDPEMISILEQPGTHPEENKTIKQKFIDLENRIDFGNGASVQFLLASRNGNLYISYMSELSQHDTAFIEQPKIKSQLENPFQNHWYVDDIRNIVGKYTPAKESIVTWITTLNGLQDQSNAVLYVFFDYAVWLKTAIAKFPFKQNYFLLNEQGDVVTQTEPGMRINEQNIRDIMTNMDGNGFYSGTYGSSVISSIPLPTFKWKLGCQFDLDLFLGNIQHLKNQFLITILILTGCFLIITFFITTLVTRPLQLLKKNMLRTADSNFKLQIAVNPYSGEITALTRAYNQMIEDIADLIHKLKLEERQKEALRFQMLVSQMNPHFLLNTLNTIKWIALEHQVNSIAEACASLGTLLESSLASESELIYLKNETELIQAYIRIQQFRFTNKIDVSFEIDEKLHFALAPKFGLQPLVENAIQHGIAPLKQKGTLIIRAYSDADKLVLEVEDDGIGLEASKMLKQRSTRKGIGLINLRERLHLMFRGEAELSLLPLPTGMLVRMKLPLLLSNPYIKEEN